MGRIKESAQRQADAQLGAATLGELAADGLGVFCWCNRCGHNAVLAIGRLVDELGHNFPVPEVGGRLRCTGCGGKDIATRPAWPGLGPVTSHAPEPAPDDQTDQTPGRAATDAAPDTLGPAEDPAPVDDPHKSGRNDG
ncbi:MAG: hypothetical protein U5L06_00055 [Rhodovibrio sp.]|nr:hypothetical protein [Rhodovibrio sp.]